MNPKKRMLIMLALALIMGILAIIIMNDFSFILGGIAIMLLGIVIGYFINSKEKM